MANIMIYVDGKPFLPEPIPLYKITNQKLHHIFWGSDGKLWTEFDTKTGKRYQEIEGSFEIRVLKD